LKSNKLTRGASLTLLISTLLLTIAQPASAAASAKQIVFMSGESSLKFTAVSISGYNQNGEWSTWKKQDKAGFSLAYTKNWWWSANYTEIAFTIQDSTGRQIAKTCTFDRLAQPANAPRVEIVYTLSKGCVGGEAGSVVDPVKDAVRPVRDAFNKIGYYLPEDKFDFFMRVVSNEMNAVSCVLGVAALVPTSGVSAVWFGPSVFMSACPKTGDMIFQIFSGR
jgi:hypothetical protein